MHHIRVSSVLGKAPTPKGALTSSEDRVIYVLECAASLITRRHIHLLCNDRPVWRGLTQLLLRCLSGLWLECLSTQHGCMLAMSSREHCRDAPAHNDTVFKNHDCFKQSPLLIVLCR